MQCMKAVKDNDCRSRDAQGGVPERATMGAHSLFAASPEGQLDGFTRLLTHLLQVGDINEICAGLKPVPCKKINFWEALGETPAVVATSSLVVFQATAQTLDQACVRNDFVFAARACRHVILMLIQMPRRRYRGAARKSNQVRFSALQTKQGFMLEAQAGIHCRSQNSGQSPLSCMRAPIANKSSPALLARRPSCEVLFSRRACDEATSLLREPRSNA